MEDTKLFTEEKDVLKQFIEMLNQQNMKESSQDFLELFKYTASMQLQLTVMMEELQGVRQQLAQLQENQSKSVKENLMDKAAHLLEKITNLSERISVVKAHLMETVVQAVNALQEKGKAEMCRVVQKGIFGVKAVLVDYQKHLDEVMLDYQKTVKQIDCIGDELK